MVRSKTMIFLTVVICCLALCFGCARKTKTTYHAQTGVLTEKTETVAGSVKSRYRADLALLVVTGVGEWTDANKALARETALTIAINDLACKAGNVLVAMDSRIFNDQAILKIRRLSANIVKGYEISYELWDPETDTMKIEIEQNAWRIVEQLEEYYPLAWAAGKSE